MANREIYKVFATQVVISQSHPEGLVSDVSGYPVPFDSRSYKATTENPNGDGDVALMAAQANYFNEIVTLSTVANENRVAWAVYILRMSDGKQIANKSWGAFPDMTPTQE